jgi:hypothetical protein
MLTPCFCATGDSRVNERDVELGRSLLQQREKGFASFCGVGVQLGEWLAVCLFRSEDRHGTETKGSGYLLCGAVFLLVHLTNDGSEDADTGFALFHKSA